MKAATSVFVGTVALCAALLAGCGSKPGPATKSAEELGIKNFQSMGKSLQNAPERKINEFHTPQEKANYLKSLGSDSNFDPKQHKSFLEQQAKDPEAEVANAAKDLLDKAK